MPDPLTRRTKSEDEEYAEYETYLDQEEYWPSVRRGVNQITVIGAMPPQQAAASLAKLMRWEREYFNGAADDPVMEHPLALALASRALNGQGDAYIDSMVSHGLHTMQALQEDDLDEYTVMSTLLRALSKSRDYPNIDDLIDHAAEVSRELGALGYKLRKIT